MSRNKNHELIMQCLYIELTYIDMKSEVDIPLIMEGVYHTPFNDIDTFSRGILIKTTKNMDEMVNHLSKYLNKWKWNRLPLLTRSILLMSCAHYKYLEKVDKAVVIEIAVKLAKKYLDKNDHKFINAILDNAL